MGFFSRRKSKPNKISENAVAEFTEDERSLLLKFTTLMPANSPDNRYTYNDLARMSGKPLEVVMRDRQILRNMARGKR